MFLMVTSLSSSIDLTLKHIFQRRRYDVTINFVQSQRIDRVVERTREIGVLRAVGARSRTIMSMFVMEGVLQGLLSWLLAVPVSYLFGKPLADGLGQTMFSATLDYQYAWQAVGAWLVIVLSISMLASAASARNAARISVRQSLAYA